MDQFNQPNIQGIIANFYKYIPANLEQLRYDVQARLYFVHQTFIPFLQDAYNNNAYGDTTFNDFITRFLGQNTEVMMAFVNSGYRIEPWFSGIVVLLERANLIFLNSGSAQQPQRIPTPGSTGTSVIPAVPTNFKVFPPERKERRKLEFVPLGFSGNQLPAIPRDEIKSSLPEKDFFTILEKIRIWNAYIHDSSEGFMNTIWETPEPRRQFEEQYKGVLQYTTMEEYMKANGIKMPIEEVYVSSDKIKFPPSTGSKSILGILIPHVGVLPGMRNQTVHLTIYDKSGSKSYYVQATTVYDPEFTGTFELGELMKGSTGFTIDFDISGFSKVADPTAHFES